MQTEVVLEEEHCLPLALVVRATVEDLKRAQE